MERGDFDRLRTLRSRRKGKCSRTESETVSVSEGDLTLNQLMEKMSPTKKATSSRKRKHSDSDFEEETVSISGSYSEEEADEEVLPMKKVRRQTEGGKERSSRQRSPNMRSLASLFVVFGRLTEEQRAWVEEMGFHYLLRMKIGKIDRNFIQWVYDKYDSEKNVLDLDEVRKGLKYEVKFDDVGYVMGIPCPSEGNHVKYEEALHREEAKRLKSEHYHCVSGIDQKLLEELVVNAIEEEQFKRDFLLYTLGTVLCPIQGNKVSGKLIEAACCWRTARQLNWGEYVIQFLKTHAGSTRKSKAKRGAARGAGVGGCYLFLALLYLDRLKRAPAKWQTQPRILAWTDEQIRDALKDDKKGKRAYGKLDMYDNVEYDKEHPYNPRGKSWEARNAELERERQRAEQGRSAESIDAEITAAEEFARKKLDVTMTRRLNRAKRGSATRRTKTKKAKKKVVLEDEDADSEADVGKGSAKQLAATKKGVKEKQKAKVVVEPDDGDNAVDDIVEQGGKQKQSTATTDSKSTEEKDNVLGEEEGQHEQGSQDLGDASPKQSTAATNTKSGQRGDKPLVEEVDEEKLQVEEETEDVDEDIAGKEGKGEDEIDINEDGQGEGRQSGGVEESGDSNEGGQKQKGRGGMQVGQEESREGKDGGEQKGKDVDVLRAEQKEALYVEPLSVVTPDYFTVKLNNRQSAIASSVLRRPSAGQVDEVVIVTKDAHLTRKELYEGLKPMAEVSKWVMHAFAYVMTVDSKNKATGAWDWFVSPMLFDKIFPTGGLDVNDPKFGDELESVGKSMQKEGNEFGQIGDCVNFFFPLIRDGHWVAYGFSPRDWEIRIFDSMHAFDSEYHAAIYKQIVPVVQMLFKRLNVEDIKPIASWTVKDRVIPVQDDNVSCGVLLLMGLYRSNIKYGKKLNPSPLFIYDYRRFLAAYLIDHSKNNVRDVVVKSCLDPVRPRMARKKASARDVLKVIADVGEGSAKKMRKGKQKRSMGQRKSLGRQGGASAECVAKRTRGKKLKAGP